MEKTSLNIVSNEPIIISKLGNRGVGYCGNFFFLFNHILRAKEDNQNNKFYCDWRGAWFSENNENAFEYTFKNKNKLTSDRIEYQFRDPSFEKSVGWNTKNFDLLNPKYVKLIEHVKYIHTIFHDNFEIQDDIEIKLNQFKSDIGNKRVLGAHLRGTDLMRHNGIPLLSENNTFDEYYYIKHLDKALKESSYDKIFVATDDMSILNVVLNEYGRDYVIYNEDCFRIEEELAKTLHKNPILDTHKFNWMFGNERENHKKRLAEEVILDVMCLSTCNALFSIKSGVAALAQIFNNFKYESINFAFDTIK